MKRLSIILILTLLLSSCTGSSPTESPASEESLSSASSQVSATEEVKEHTIPVTVKNYTKAITLNGISINDSYTPGGPYIFKSINPEETLETDWAPFRLEYENSRALWFSYPGPDGFKRIYLQLDLATDIFYISSIDLVLEEKETLLLTATFSKEGLAPSIIKEFTYNAEQDVWYLQTPETLVYGVYLSEKQLADTSLTAESLHTNSLAAMSLFCTEPITDLKYWTRPYNSYDLNKGYGSYPLELVNNIGKLNPSEHAIILVSNQDYIRNFITFKDAKGIEHVQRIIYRSNHAKSPNPIALSSILTAQEWELATAEPEPFRVEYSVEIVNSTGKTIEEVTAKIGADEASVYGSLSVGETASIQWSYTGPSFLYDNTAEGGESPWAPVFILKIGGQEIMVDQLRICDDDIRQEYTFNPTYIEFLQDKNGVIFCTPQKNYLNQQEDPEDHIENTTYLYLPQVYRWMHREVPGQLLFGVGISSERMYDALFPHLKDSLFPTIGSIAVMITYQDIYLDDATFEYKEDSSDFVYNEKTLSTNKTLYSVNDAAIYSLDHVRSPNFYFRYRGSDGTIIRLYIADQFRDGNNGSVQNIIMDPTSEYDAKYYTFEDIK